MKSSRPPLLEQLEDRCVPAAYGNPWPDAAHLTLSFAPDGTDVDGQASVLYQTLDAAAPTADWQREVLRAFQTWAQYANINIGLVADGGQAFGAAGRPQGDPRFGDVRLGAYVSAPGEMAAAGPFDPTAGTRSGDVAVNTTYAFGVGGGGAVDLYTAMLHEAAHALGLDHSQDPASAVYEDYLGPRTAPLTAEDVSRIRALYGARTPDAFEGAAGNDTLATATGLNLLANPDGSLGIQADGDLTTHADVDVYRFQAPLNVGALDVTLHTAGLSLLTARVTVYDAAGRAVGSAASTDPLTGDLRVRVAALLPLGTYNVKVQASTGDVFGIGGYQLQVRSLSLLQTATGLLSAATQQTTQTLLNNDQHTNDSFLTASLLPPLTQTSSEFAYAYRASVSDGSDVDLYRVRAGQPAGGQQTVLTVMLWGLDGGGLVSRASVYDANQNLVASALLVNENGIFALQVPDAVAGADYFVKVEAADARGPNNVGNYFLAVDFSSKAIALNTLASGTLSQPQPQAGGGLAVEQAQTLHFVLSVQADSPSAAAGVRMTITDSSGRVVASVTAYNGRDPVSVTATLPAGSYAVLFAAFTTDGSPLPTLRYTLQAERLDDPIGPQAENSTSTPSGSPPPPSGSSTTTSSTSSGSTTTTSGSTTTTSSSSTTSTSSGSTSSSSSSGGTTSADYQYSSQPENSYSSPYKPT